MTEHTIELSRYSYLVLAYLCATGFVATLYVRWDELKLGERIIRVGLILEHLFIAYGAFIAIKHGFPGSVVALLLVISMLVMLLGLLVWLVEDLIPRYRTAR